MIRYALLAISLVPLSGTVGEWVTIKGRPQSCSIGLSREGLTRRREGAKELKMRNVVELSAEVVGTAFGLHKDLVPGRFESVYEAVLAQRGLRDES